MLYVYVLRSKVDGNFYIGQSADLKKRLLEHNTAQVPSTQRRIPLELVYYEACTHRSDALHREKYLKTTYGHRYLRNRLKYGLLSA